MLREAPIQSECCPYKKGKIVFTEKLGYNTLRKEHVRIQQEDRQAESPQSKSFMPTP